MKKAWLGILLIPVGIVASCSGPQSSGRGGGTGGATTVTTDAGPGSCKDVTCDPNATCELSGGVPTCTCRPGYEGDGKSCTDTDECKDATSCGEHARCTNRPGTFSCACDEGFVSDGKKCNAVNACADGQSLCDPNAVCSADSSGATCTCNAGYTGDGKTCGDVDECKKKTFSCAANAHCENTFGAFDCACDAGYSGDGNKACTALCDAAKADSSTCAANGLCRVNGTTAVCDACAPGYTGSGTTCTASTKCDAKCDGAGTDDAAHAVCLADGSCDCAPGYEGSPGSCKDVDECGNDVCGPNSNCTNTDGGYLCACAPGYQANSKGDCVDKDECKQNPCHPDATCKNTTPDADPKGYTCTCKDGFTGDGTVCTDIDECAASDGGGCGDGSTCVNKRGTFTCECQPPLVGEGGKCHCDLSGLWAMRQDVDTCWKARQIQEGAQQDLVSPGSMEATVWELHEITYDGTQFKERAKGCSSDNSPDLISPLFAETYSSYVPDKVFDDADLADAASFKAPGLVPGSDFKTPSIAAVMGLDLGDDPLNAPWPASYKDVTKWTDPDGDGEPGVTLWPRLPSQITDTKTGKYSYLPARPGLGGSNFYIDQRAGCVSVGLRVVTHIEAHVDSCTKITGKVVNEKTEGRVHSCSIVDKGDKGANACPVPADPNKWCGWSKDITCNADDWKAATKCADQDLDRLDDDQNQAQNTNATFELVRVGDVGANVTCQDVRDQYPAIVRRTPTITCQPPK